MPARNYILGKVISTTRVRTGVRKIEVQQQRSGSTSQLTLVATTPNTKTLLVGKQMLFLTEDGDVVSVYLAEDHMKGILVGDLLAGEDRLKEAPRQTERHQNLIGFWYFDRVWGA